MTPSGGAPATTAEAKPAKAPAPAAKKTPAAPEKRESSVARPIERPPAAPAADKSPAAAPPPDGWTEPPPPVAVAPAANHPPLPPSSEDDDRYAAIDESSMAEEEPGDWIHSVSLAELAKEDLGPSGVRREVLALEAAVQRVPADVRNMLESELKATFREVRPYTKPRDG
ncbi:MAG: hypothetical protein JJU00_00785 [Opitutales bacterium]|nr:hypothetical protein [Opitutales bacterium]